jgi:hypothetical protein
MYNIWYLIVIGKDKKEIKDIDMGFGCSARGMMNIAQKHNWWKSHYSISPFGMVQLGDTTKELYLEGKSINGAFLEDLNLFFIRI